MFTPGVATSGLMIDGRILMCRGQRRSRSVVAFAVEAGADELAIAGGGGIESLACLANFSPSLWWWWHVVVFEAGLSTAAIVDGDSFLKEGEV
ncbi:hypothetical protein ACLOJK_007534 [Asimina triloba]